MRLRLVPVASLGYERDTAESANSAIAKPHIGEAILAHTTSVPEGLREATEVPVRRLIDSMRFVLAMQSIVWLQSTAFGHLKLDGSSLQYFYK